MTRRELSRRAAIVVPAMVLSAVPPAGAALDAYCNVMDQCDAVNASPEWADVERWCEDESAALDRLAASPGGVADLLRKVVIMADRADDEGWNLMASEHALLASMRDQAEGLLRQGRMAA